MKIMEYEERREWCKEYYKEIKESNFLKSHHFKVKIIYIAYHKISSIIYRHLEMGKVVRRELSKMIFCRF